MHYRLKDKFTLLYTPMHLTTTTMQVGGITHVWLVIVTGSIRPLCIVNGNNTIHNDINQVTFSAITNLRY